MLPILQIGPLAIRLPGLLILLGLWLGLYWAEKQLTRYRLGVNDLYNLVFIGLLSGVIGARVFFALQNTRIFLDDPLSLLSLDTGLLDPLGGLLAGGVAALAFIQRKKLALRQVLDALVPVLAIVQVSFGLAHISSGSAFGAPADLPWSIFLWGTERHPTQIYETIFALLILISLIVVRKWRITGIPGFTFLFFIALSTAARIFVEGFRGDSLLLTGGFRTAQILAWLLLAASLWGIGRLVESPAAELDGKP